MTTATVRTDTSTLALLGLAQAGSRSAEATLLGQLEGLLRTIAGREYHRVRSPRPLLSWDDCLQEGRLAIVRAIRAYDPGGPRPWLRFVARRIRKTVLRAIERSAVEAGEDPADLDLAWPARDEESDDSTSRAVAPLLDLLTVRERQVLSLSFGLADGTHRTDAEVAQNLGISRSRVTAFRNQALRRLRAAGRTLPGANKDRPVSVPGP